MKTPRTLTIRLPPADINRWKQAAGDIPLSRWVRNIINQHLNQRGGS